MAKVQYFCKATVRDIRGGRESWRVFAMFSAIGTLTGVLQQILA